VRDWSSRYQWAIQLRAPASAKAVIFGSHGSMEPSWMPSRIRRRIPWSISDLSDLMWRLMAGGKILVFRPPHPPPTSAGAAPRAVVTQHGIQPLPRGYRQLAHGAERGADLLHSCHEALEQQLLLAGDVVVDRRLGDLEPGGDVVERGVVVALAVELACCG